VTTAPHADWQSIAEAFRKQVAWCRALDSPFSARVLASLAADIEAEGILPGIIGDWPGDPVADALSLRVLGALHALVLTGAAPALASLYPPHSAASDAVLWQAVLNTVAMHAPFIRAFLTIPPQTNEVGRSAVLLGGFLEIAKATAGLPLRLLEIGASAGLNLIWDRYRYQLGEGAWGDLASPVRLAPRWTGGLPPLDVPMPIASRAACDLAPVDLGDGAARLRLRAFVWADQTDRLARVDQAIGLAQQAGHPVEQADAGDWVADRLAQAQVGQVTVLYHSIMWQYMPAATQRAIEATVLAAGGRASANTPVAWLRFEPAALDAAPDLRLTIWPSGEERVLARAHPHGRAVHWLRFGVCS
jgi:hypothetical protein